MTDAEPAALRAPRWHGAWVEVDADALASNVGVLRRAVPPRTEVGILVKANGYGHGLEISARAALAGGADRLVVATLDEALAVRALGVQAPILVVYPIPLDGLREAAVAGLELTVSGEDGARRTVDAWEAMRGAAGPTLALHLEVDSGMGRGGIAPDRAVDAARRITGSPGARLAGTWSHLADGADAGRTAEQIARYEATLAALHGGGIDPGLRHVAATEGVVVGTAPAYDLVRIGLAFYGELGVDVAPAPALAAVAGELRPALRLVARPVRVEPVPAGATIGYGGEWIAERPTVIATLPVGYADGWPRRSWPGGTALVRGRRVPLVGRVSMDAVCADVTDVGGVTIDDEVVLIGDQGGDRISVEEVARQRGTIPNEVLATLGARLPRRARAHHAIRSFPGI